MQVHEEMESARESRIRPGSSILRQRARRESVRSFSPKLLRCLADTQLSERKKKETPRPSCPLVLSV